MTFDRITALMAASLAGSSITIGIYRSDAWTILFGLLLAFLSVTWEYSSEPRKEDQ